MHSTTRCRCSPAARTPGCSASPAATRTATPPAPVVRHLADHGITAKPEVLVVEDFGIMDLLLNRVSDRSADLLVMGAHGQIGFPFVSRGAGTRYILQHMTVPVLMSS
jgi:nucleotide-binding universal stress UspA family protein